MKATLRVDLPYDHACIAMSSSESAMSSSATAMQRMRAYAVHLYTASGVGAALLAALELCASQPDPRWVFAWLALAGFIDATDGPFARRWDVKRFAASIDGRTIDDILDYMTFTFLPLLLVVRMDWLAGPDAVWAGLAMVASLLGFAHVGAKEEGGFFRGFPSYWNLVAFYIGLWAQPPYLPVGPVASTIFVLVLAVLTVAPVWLLYPNMAPAPWRWLVLGGAYAWVLLLAALLPWYPDVPVWLMLVSVLYPLFYTLLSWRLSKQRVPVGASSS